jgi:hypothetical protein
MYGKLGDCAAFASLGIAPRHIFSHYALLIPKAYPDSQLLLEQRGVPDRLLKSGTFYQLNLYASDSHGLPDDLFMHPEINWHHQQFGLKGLIASAGLWVRDSTVTITTLQSDLCQQLCRHALGQACKTRVETRFKYWYRFLFNAVLDACLDVGISTVYSPTGREIMTHTKKQIRPDLFLRIYDFPQTKYRCRRVTHCGAEYWVIPVKANADRTVRLVGQTLDVLKDDGRKNICIFHDIEENVDAPVSVMECRTNLQRMLAIEKQLGVTATYCILGRLLDRNREIILGDNPHHAIGFHSVDHDVTRLDQLSRCREIDLRVRGYRPPKSQITAELTDANLAYENFEWFASSSHSFGHNECILQNGIVKIPIHQDDYPLFMGRKEYPAWECELFERAKGRLLIGFGLHDCYASKWLDRYPELLEKLASLGKFVTADEVCDRMYLRATGPMSAVKNTWLKGVVAKMGSWLPR